MTAALGAAAYNTPCIAMIFDCDSVLYSSLLLGKINIINYCKYFSRKHKVSAYCTLVVSDVLHKCFMPAPRNNSGLTRQIVTVFTAAAPTCIWGLWSSTITQVLYTIITCSVNTTYIVSTFIISDSHCGSIRVNGYW